MPRVVKAERLAPNTFVIVVESADVARRCQPGQFVMVMPDENGERIPLNIADWDRERGHVSVVFMNLGTTTRKLARLKAGADLPVFAGPLGKPAEVGRFGTVLLVGGCYGPGALLNVAAAMKKAGNRVIVLIEAKAPYLLYWQDELGRASDRLVRFTQRPEGAGGEAAAFIGPEVKRLIKEEKVVRVMAIGCTHLMAGVAEATKPLGVKTTVMLNPIMLDGTGMCGACRVSVGGRTCFACVDGPEFDGHKVDWAELNLRRKAYLDHELESLCRWEKKNCP